MRKNKLKNHCTVPLQDSTVQLPVLKVRKRVDGKKLKCRRRQNMYAIYYLT